MLQIEDLLLPPVTTLMPGHASARHATARCCWRRLWLAPARPPATAPSRCWSAPSHNPDRSPSESWFAPGPRLRVAKGNRCSRSITMPAPTVCSRPAITRCSSCWQASKSCRFRSARSAASGTGTQWLRRKYPASPSMPPFSCGSAGVQNSASNRQCERNATNRAVSSRRVRAGSSSPPR